ncbi:MAG: hypothetical protein HY060_09405 [Proteobacteria bacterium]|nr:hypothetical protein [Pseudomonadota bacterium]
MSRRALFLRIVGALLLALAVAVWWRDYGATLAGVLPAFGYAAVMVTFARTLRRGHEPLITRFCRLHHGHLPEECRGYTRRLTVIWAGVTGACALEVAALPLLGWADWIGPVNLINLGLMVALFLGEHALRARVFPHLPSGSPLDTGRIMLQSLRSR